MRSMKFGLGIVWFALVGALVIIFILGSILAHSQTFKARCAAHKITGVSIGVVTNVVCDLDFDLG